MKCEGALVGSKDGPDGGAKKEGYLSKKTSPALGLFPDDMEVPTALRARGNSSVQLAVDAPSDASPCPRSAADY